METSENESITTTLRKSTKYSRRVMHSFIDASLHCRAFRGHSASLRAYDGVHGDARGNVRGYGHVDVSQRHPSRGAYGLLVFQVFQAHGDRTTDAWASDGFPKDLEWRKPSPDVRTEHGRRRLQSRLPGR